MSIAYEETYPCATSCSSCTCPDQRNKPTFSVDTYVRHTTADPTHETTNDVADQGAYLYCNEDIGDHCLMNIDILTPSSQYSCSKQNTDAKSRDMIKGTKRKHVLTVDTVRANEEYEQSRHHNKQRMTMFKHCECCDGKGFFPVVVSGSKCSETHAWEFRLDPYSTTLSREGHFAALELSYKEKIDTSKGTVILCCCGLPSAAAPEHLPLERLAALVEQTLIVEPLKEPELAAFVQNMS